MSRKRFEEVHKLTAEFEGGWSNHPKDPGGKTMYGVTERVYHAWLRKNKKPKKPVRDITMAEALDLYFEEYWLAAGCDKLALGVDRMTYDAAVNSGVSRARKWLLSSIGGEDAITVMKMADVRMTFLRGLNTWPTFGKGWSRRVNAMEKAALAEVSRKPVEAKKEVQAPVVPKAPEKAPTASPDGLKYLAWFAVAALVILVALTNL